MSDQFYQMYLEELRAIPACSQEEIVVLLQQLPDEGAVKRLAEGSLSYVAEEAKHHVKEGVELSDLIQEGNMALMLMLRHYSDSRDQEKETGEARFLRLRELAVKTAMEQLVAEQAQNDQTAEKLAASVNVLNVVTTKLAQELGRQATLSEIAEKMKLSEDEVQILMKTAISAVNVDRSAAAEASESEEESTRG